MQLLLTCVLAVVLAAANVGGEVSPAELNEEGCGVLVGGTVVSSLGAAHLPWVVRLGHRKGGRMVYGCVGTLIGRRLVLTAARCVQPDNMPTLVVVPSCGGSDTCATHGEPRYYGVRSTSPHPAFSAWPGDNDIAVVRLDRAIASPRAGGTPAICLPMGYIPTASLFNSELVLAVWNVHENGTTEEERSLYYKAPLRTIVVPVVPDAECQRQLGESVSLQDSQLCAGGQGNEPCSGGTGAPLHALVGDPLQAMLVGIVSMGMPQCGNSSVPKVYTKVDAHLHWLLDTMLTLQDY